MKRLAYRKNRVKVTDDIFNTLFDLIVKENDLEKKKKHPAKWYRESVAKTLKLQDVDNPSLRSYEDKITLIKNGLKQDNPLDSPWSIGACIKYDIQETIIPPLLELKSHKREQITPPIDDPRLNKIASRANYERSRWPTIRHARWFAKLYPLIIPILEAQEPDSPPIKKLGYVFLIACQYAQKEKVSDILGKDLDTSELDKHYLIEKSLDIGEGMLIAFDHPSSTIDFYRKLRINKDGEK